MAKNTNEEKYKMTRKLEEEFDLPHLDEIKEEERAKEREEEASNAVVTIDEINEALANAEKIDNALPTVRGLESHDTDMDDYATMAEAGFKDLMELGMNVESRVAGEILQAANNMLKNAITAKNAKADKKLKMIELQLRKMKQDQEERKVQIQENQANKENNTGVVEGEGYVVADRNEILKSIFEEKDK